MEETLKNLGKAFIGESQARNRYTFFAKQALKEGYIQLSDIFTVTAEQEREHAKKIAIMIQDVKDLMKKAKKKVPETIELDTHADAGMGDTQFNLKGAIAGETYETEEMYPAFAKQADKDGLPEVAKRLRSIAVAERHHAERYQKFLDGIKAGSLWKKEKVTIWVCRECGYQHIGKEPPKECPSCGHASNYFLVKCEEY
ncbi:Rubrerythrin [uncultured archaeon]|nr:Rubrerythrin [uncultured archaeon]